MIWHSETIDEVLSALGSNAEKGLDEQQAARLMEEKGPNKLNEKPPKTFIQRFLEQMKDVMVIILIIAAVISLGSAAIISGPARKPNGSNRSSSFLSF